MSLKACLLKLNRHWVSATGASLIGLVLVINTPPAIDALAKLFGSTVTEKIQAAFTLVGILGGVLTYLGRPGTVSQPPTEPKP